MSTIAVADVGEAHNIDSVTSSDTIAAVPDVGGAHNTDDTGPVAPPDTSEPRADAVVDGQDAVPQVSNSAYDRASYRSGDTTPDGSYSARRRASRSASRERRRNRPYRQYMNGRYLSPPSPGGRQSDKPTAEAYIDDSISGLCAAIAR